MNNHTEHRKMATSDTSTSGTLRGGVGATPDHALPLRGQKVALMGANVGRITGFEHLGALTVPGKHGAVFITREAAKEFFGLVEPLKPGAM